MERLLTRIAWFLGLVLVQVLLLNNITLFGLATPFLYIYFVLVLDRDIDRNVLMLIAFVLGLLVDVFSNTPGVNAGASVFLAFIRPTLLRLSSPRDEFENFEPSISVLGIWPFFRYVFMGTFAHHTLLFVLEAFSFANAGHLFLRVLCSALLSVTLVMAVEFIRHRR